MKSRCSCCDGKDVRAMFCPSCRSTDVGYTFGLGNLFGVIPRMRCRECGYTAQVFPVLVAKKSQVAGRRSKVGKAKATVKARKKVVKKVKKKKVVRKR